MEISLSAPAGARVSLLHHIISSCPAAFVPRIAARSPDRVTVAVTFSQQQSRPRICVLVTDVIVSIDKARTASNVVNSLTSPDSEPHALSPAGIPGLPRFSTMLCPTDDSWLTVSLSNDSLLALTCRGVLLSGALRTFNDTYAIMNCSNLPFAHNDTLTLVRNCPVIDAGPLAVSHPSAASVVPGPSSIKSAVIVHPDGDKTPVIFTLRTVQSTDSLCLGRWCFSEGLFSGGDAATVGAGSKLKTANITIDNEVKQVLAVVHGDSVDILSFDGTYLHSNPSLPPTPTPSFLAAPSATTFRCLATSTSHPLVVGVTEPASPTDPIDAGLLVVFDAVTGLNVGVTRLPLSFRRKEEIRIDLASQASCDHGLYSYILTHDSILPISALPQWGASIVRRGAPLALTPALVTIGQRAIDVDNGDIKVNSSPLAAFLPPARHFFQGTTLPDVTKESETLLAGDAAAPAAAAVAAAIAAGSLPMLLQGCAALLALALGRTDLLASVARSWPMLADWARQQGGQALLPAQPSPLGTLLYDIVNRISLLHLQAGEILQQFLRDVVEVVPLWAVRSVERSEDLLNVVSLPAKAPKVASSAWIVRVLQRIPNATSQELAMLLPEMSAQDLFVVATTLPRQIARLLADVSSNSQVRDLFVTEDRLTVTPIVVAVLRAAVAASDHSKMLHRLINLAKSCENEEEAKKSLYNALIDIDPVLAVKLL